MFLTKALTLRSLKLYLSYLDLAQYIHIVEGIVSPTASPVPNLEEFRGPHKLLPIILGQAMRSTSGHLRRLCLGSIVKAGDALDDFMNSFKSCHPLQLRDLTHLHISLLDSMDLKSLAKLQDIFPVLQEFYLHGSENCRNHPPGLSCKFFEFPCPFNATLPPLFAWIALVKKVDLTDLYTLPLPSTLVSLSIQWTSDPDAVPDLIAAKDSLLPRLPNLRRLWLTDFSKTSLLWSWRASRSEECCILQDGE
jgi:hypothetical protein